MWVTITRTSDDQAGIGKFSTSESAKSYLAEILKPGDRYCLFEFEDSGQDDPAVLDLACVTAEETLGFGPDLVGQVRKSLMAGI
jgi:hypothetical protein